MRTTVAVIAARPETIGDDYARVLDLAGMSAMVGDAQPQVLLATDPAGFVPGWAATPWQLDGVLSWLGERSRGVSVAAVGKHGASPAPSESIWQDCLVKHLAQGADSDFLRTHRHVSGLLHPALDSLLPAGVEVPVGLSAGPALLLAAPSLQRGWGLSAGVDLLRRLVTNGGRESRRAPAAEVVAEALGVARELMPQMGLVVDGTLWGVSEGADGKNCVARNILLAGRDPLAVDVVAMRLAGIDPLRVPWVRICQDRGFGQAHPAAINVVGQTELLDLDFGLNGGTFAAQRDGLLSVVTKPLSGLMGRGGGRQAVTSMAETAWGQLHTDYVTGLGIAATGS